MHNEEASLLPLLPSKIVSVLTVLFSKWGQNTFMENIVILFRKTFLYNDGGVGTIVKHCQYF